MEEKQYTTWLNKQEFQILCATLVSVSKTRTRTRRTRTNGRRRKRRKNILCIGMTLSCHYWKYDKLLLQLTFSGSVFTRIALGMTNAVFSFVMLLISAQGIVTYQGETWTDKSENMKDIFTLSCCACSISTIIIWPVRPRKRFHCKSIEKIPIWGPYVMVQAGPEKAIRTC